MKQKIVIKILNQDNWWEKSLNVLVPLEIQGKEGFLIEKELPPNTQRGSVSARVEVNGKIYGIPGFAYKIQCSLI